MMRPAPHAAQIHHAAAVRRPARTALRKPRRNPVWTASAATSAGVSVSGRAAVNQKSGDVDRHHRRQARAPARGPTAIQKRTSTKRRSVPAMSPQIASPAAARRSRSQPGAITQNAAVDAFAIAMKTG